MNKQNYFPIKNGRGAFWLLLSLNNYQREAVMLKEVFFFRLPKAHPFYLPVKSKPKQINAE